MEPVIKKCTKTLLAGHSILMSLSDNRTLELWKGFMPQRKNIMNVVGTSLYSVQVFPAEFDFCNFHPGAIFEKWAAVAVKDIDDLPAGMKPLCISEGLYAVFQYKGSSSEGPTVFRYIFSEWLPASGYQVDARPHFEILGEKYRNNDPESEEEIWIPVR